MASGSSAGASGGADLTGAGSTFAFPLYSKWADEYVGKAGVKVEYQSIGSGAGIRQLSEGTVDFGATDGPMSDAELANAKGGPVLHIPTALGAVVITYNVPGVASRLKLAPDMIADIFLGKLTKWNDARLQSLNPEAKLPAQDILVVHRSDGSGTTFVFTDYLATVSPEWSKAVGRGKDVRWPVGIGGRGNEGVAGEVKQTPGSIGYVELTYAKKGGLSIAAVKNAAGAFVTPSVESVTAAAAGVAEKLPPSTDYRVSIVNAPGAAAYPISSFTWILAYSAQKDSAKARKLFDFIRWGLTDGQAFEAGLDYAPLPPTIAKQILDRLGPV